MLFGLTMQISQFVPKLKKTIFSSLILKLEFRFWIILLYVPKVADLDQSWLLRIFIMDNTLFSIWKIILNLNLLIEHKIEHYYYFF